MKMELRKGQYKKLINNKTDSERRCIEKTVISYRVDDFETAGKIHGGGDDVF